MPFSDPLHPLWKPENLRRAIHAAGVALWSWNVTNDRFAMDEQAFRLWGLVKNGEVKFEDLSAHVHPADRDRVRAAFTATRGIVGPYEIDFRIMVGNEIRWISARGLGDDAALHNGQMFGVFLDVTGRKQAEEGNELLAGEMSHRVKNLFGDRYGPHQHHVTVVQHRQRNGKRVDCAASSSRKSTRPGAANPRCAGARRAIGRSPVGASCAVRGYGSVQGAHTGCCTAHGCRRSSRNCLIACIS